MRIGFKDSVEAGNGYSFHCPVVDRDTRFLVCAFKSRKVMKGEDIADHDCVCAMRGNKCPARHMQRQEWDEETRIYHDAEPRMHAVPKSIIERIERLMLIPAHANGLTLTEEQQKLLFGEGLKLRNHAGTQEQPTSPTAPTRRSKPKSTAATSHGTIADNVLSGVGSANIDMADMLNQSIANSGE